MAQNNQISKKRKFINDGIFKSELNEFLRRMLAEDGYAGVDVRPRPNETQIIIKCTKTAEVVTRIPFISKLLELRHGHRAGIQKINVYAEKMQPRGLSARAQAQSICYKLKGGLAVRRACYSGLKFIMDHGGAKGVQIVISGKLRGARAKCMKFKEGYMITSGEATKSYIKEAVEHVLLRQGTIGVRVTIMLPHDPTGKEGVAEQLPDVVIVHEPKVEVEDPMPRQGQEEYPPQQDQYQPQQQQQQQAQQPAYGNFQQDQGYGQTPGGPAPPQQQQSFQQQPPQQQYNQQYPTPM